MTQTAIIWPMIAHVLLVYIVYVLVLLRRTAAVKAGNATVAQFRENQNEPSESIFVRNNLANQFELPVLFHAVCLALAVTGGATGLAVTLAWIFIASRYAHAVVHIRGGRIGHRQKLFGLGFLVLAIMWIVLAVQIVS
ncbi:MAPEG family protein [Nitratireductor basaltis]|nr:MAPEG family protein [Nitratireductor basaltis]